MKTKIKNHSFDIEVAEQTSIEFAIILNNLIFWIDVNRLNNRNYYDGRHWMYNSISSFQKQFPYMTPYTIKKVLGQMEEMGCIYTGNYNEDKRDRTKWYAINYDHPLLQNLTSSSTTNQKNPVGKKGQMQKSKTTNGEIENDSPLPDTLHTDTNNKKKIYKKKSPEKEFTPPTEKEVIEYVWSKGYSKSIGEQAFAYYDEMGWRDKNGNPVRSWKLKLLQVWLRNADKIPKSQIEKEKSVNVRTISADELENRYKHLYE